MDYTTFARRNSPENSLKKSELGQIARKKEVGEKTETIMKLIELRKDHSLPNLKINIRQVGILTDMTKEVIDITKDKIFADRHGIIFRGNRPQREPRNGWDNKQETK